MMSEVKSQFGGADICINNAGLGHYATLLSGSSTMWREMLEVNYIILNTNVIWEISCEIIYVINFNTFNTIYLANGDIQPSTAVSS